MKNLCVIVLFALLILTSCKNSDLSRDEAADLLLNKLDWLKTGVIIDSSVKTSPYGFGWLYAGNLNTEGEVENFTFLYNQSIEVIFLEDGINIQSKQDGVVLRRNDAMQVNPIIEVRKPLRIAALENSVNYSIEISGIKREKEGDNSRTVEFTWKQNPLPAMVKLLSFKGGEGLAKFQLYDDGWRIENIALVPSETKFVLSENELAELERFKEIEDQRKIELEKQRQLEWEQKEKEYVESIKETKPLAIFKYSHTPSPGLTNLYTTTISSTYIRVDLTFYYGKKVQWVKTSNIPFANIRQIIPTKTKLDIRTFCRKEYPKIGDMGIDPLVSAYISKNELKKAIATANQALAEWKYLNKEFYGKDWQKSHYGKTCR